MRVIGVTGGIGSGKSYVCSVFKLLGATVYVADDEAKRIMTSDNCLIRRIQSRFGAECYNNDGTLNRLHLSNIVFSDRAKREQLNAIVHPVLQTYFLNFVEECDQNGQEVVIIEAAILIESGFHHLVDEVVLVCSDDNLRITRTMQRDGATKEQVISRIEAQTSDREREKYSDYIIHNNEKELLLPQIVSILEKIEVCS